MRKKVAYNIPGQLISNYISKTETQWSFTCFMANLCGWLTIDVIQCWGCRISYVFAVPIGVDYVSSHFINRWCGWGTSFSSEEESLQVAIIIKTMGCCRSRTSVSLRFKPNKDVLDTQWKKIDVPQFLRGLMNDTYCF